MFGDTGRARGDLIRLSLIPPEKGRLAARIDNAFTPVGIGQIGRRIRGKLVPVQYSPLRKLNDMFGDNVTGAASVSGRCEHAAGSLDRFPGVVECSGENFYLFGTKP